MLISRLLSIVGLSFLSGCADLSSKLKVPEGGGAYVINEGVLTAAEGVGKKSMDSDVFFTLLTAELAGQRGQYLVALNGYIEAAKQTHNPKFAERAVMIAMYVKDNSKIKEAMDLWLQQVPKDFAVRKTAVLSALKLGDEALAVEHLSVMLTLDAGGFEAAIIELTGILQKEGKDDVVSDAIDALLVQKKDNAEIYYIQSLFALQRKDVVLAETKIQEALRFRPNWDKAIIFRAQIYVASGDVVRAKSLLSEAVNKYPSNPKINKMYAQILIRSEHYKEAMSVYKHVVVNNPKDMESQFSVGLIYLQLNQDQDAENVFKKMLEQPEWEYQASYYLGKIEEKKGNFKKALAWFDKVVDGPLAFDASISAVLWLQKDKQFDEAVSRLSELQVKFPKERRRLILVQSDVYSQQKQFDKAYKLLSAGLIEYPDQKEFLYARALIAERLGQSGNVEIDLNKILSNDPNNVEALNAMGYTLLSHSDRYLDAEKFLKKALSIEPEQAVIIDSYGWLQYKLGNMKSALMYLQKAYEKQKETEIAAHLMEVLWFYGKKSEAEKLFKSAFRASPSDEYLKDFQRRILKGHK